MRLQVISYAEVAADVASIKARRDTSNPSSRSQRFSTAHHNHLEILPIVPESASFKHESPPWSPYRYTLWIPFVARFQGITDQKVVNIPGFLYEDLMRCHSAWVATGKIHKSLLDDVTETWLATKSGKELAQSLDGKKKWFIRLDQMSPKDSPLGGKQPSSTLQDVITKVCSSMRAYGALGREFEEAKAENREMVIKLILNRWDEEMDAGKEFRVFVPPPTVRGKSTSIDDLDIAAISQYKWVAPFETAENMTVSETIDLVLQGTDIIFGKIKEYIKNEIEEGMQKLLVKYGFSFDVGLKQDNSVQIIEVNPFGALSGCGACLFNWVRDGRALYGLEEGLVFCITLEEEPVESEERVVQA